MLSRIIFEFVTDRKSGMKYLVMEPANLLMWLSMSYSKLQQKCLANMIGLYEKAFESRKSPMD